MNSTNNALTLNIYGFLTKESTFPEDPLSYKYDESQLKVLIATEYFDIPIYFPYVKCDVDYVSQIYSLLKKKDNKICFSIPFITGANLGKYPSSHYGERLESKQAFYKEYYFRKNLIGGVFASLEIASIVIEDFCVPTEDQIEIFNFLKEEKTNGSIKELGFTTVTSKTGLFERGLKEYLSLFTFVASSWSYPYYCLKRAWVESFVAAARTCNLRVVLMGHGGVGMEQPVFKRRHYTQYLLRHLVDEIRISMTDEVFVNENYNRFDRKSEWKFLPVPGLKQGAADMDAWNYPTLPLESWVREAGCIQCNQCDYYCPKDLYPSFCFSKKDNLSVAASEYITKAKEICNSCGSCEKACPQHLSIIPLVKGNNNQ